MKRLFITQKRLQNSNFYRSIEMVQKLNPDSPITMPKVHENYVRSAWSTLSPGNAYMCLFFMEYAHTQYDWKVNPEAAHKIFDLIFSNTAYAYINNLHSLDKKGELRGQLLTSPILEESRFNELIDKYLTNRGTIQDLLSNPSLKTYQYLKIFTHYKEELASDDKITAFVMLTREVKFEIIPDDIFYILAQHAINNPDGGDWRYRECFTKIVGEALTRKMLVLRGTPSPVKQEVSSKSAGAFKSIVVKI